MPEVYCGNNSSDVGLLNGSKVLGTRSRCLRKGVGRGMRLPYDPTYLGAYTPIDNRNIYCGDQEQIPEGYSAMGNLPQCLVKGIGICKKKRAEKGPPVIRQSVPYIIFLILAGSLFTALYLYEPSIVTTTSSDNVTSLDWVKFMSFYIPTCVLIAVVIFLVNNRI